MEGAKGRLLEKERGIVLDRTTRGTGQDTVEGFYEGFSCLKGDCWRRRDRKQHRSSLGLRCRVRGGGMSMWHTILFDTAL